MKARLATALSIAGVVVTGGAAFAMNSSLLDTEPVAQGSAALATVVAVDTTAVADDITSVPGTPASPGVVSAGVVADSLTPTRPTSTVAINDQQALRPLALNPEPAPTTSAPLASTTIAPVPSTAPEAPVVRQFDVEDFASIFLTVSGTQLSIENVRLTPGSQYVVSNRYASGDTVRITLNSPTRTVEFSARLSNGEIVAAISNPTSALLPPPRRHDDDDHDEDEHDDDHNEHEGREHNREDDDD